MPKKLNVLRADDLTRIPRTITAKDAVNRLKRAGFELERERSGHRIMRKGDQQIVLPSTGYCNPWLSQQVVKVASQGQPVSSTEMEVLPLTVMYRDRPYAVVDKRGPQYILTGLDDGERVMAMVLECRTFNADDLEPREVAAPEPPSDTEVLEPEPPILTIIPVPTEEEAMPDSPQAAWVKYTQELIDDYNRQVDDLYGEIEKLEAERDVLVKAIGLVSGTSDDSDEGEDDGLVDNRRPVHHLTQHEIEQIEVQAKQGVPQAEIARNLNLTTGAVQSRIARLRRQGKLSA